MSTIQIDRNKLLQAIEDNDDDEIKNILSMKQYNFVDTISAMFRYSIKNNDEELLDNLIVKYDDYDFWEKYDLCLTEIGNANNVIIDKILTIKNFIPENMSELYEHSVRCGNIYLLDKLSKLRCIPNKRNLAMALFYGPNEYVDSIIHMYNNNPQKIFEDYFGEIGGYYKLTSSKIKHILSIGVDISKYLNMMVLDAIEYEDNDELVKFLHQLGATNIDEILEQSCMYENINLMKYFLQCGATIDTNNMINYRKTNYDVVKLLLDYNYNFSNDVINNIFVKMLKNNDIFDIECMFDQFDNLNLKNIFENENCENYDATILDHIIFHNKLDNMKFIIKHNGNNLNIKKLVMIASLNGHIDIVKILLDVNDDIDYNDALKCAITFGHYDMIKYLLKYDIVIDDDMLQLCIIGIKSNNNKLFEKYNITYQKFKTNFIYLDDRSKILNLLFDCGAKLTFEMFEKIEYCYYELPIVIHMIESGYDVNKIFDKYVTYCNTKYIVKLQIIKYLLDNGANPNIIEIANTTIKKYLNDYGYL